MKRLKADLQSSRNAEQEYKGQLHSVISSDKTLRNELHQLRQDNESLQNKYVLATMYLITHREQKKQVMSAPDLVQWSVLLSARNGQNAFRPIHTNLSLADLSAGKWS